MKLLSALYHEINPFPNIFDSMDAIREPKDIHLGDALILWGGEDIGTLLYGEKPNSRCWRAKPTSRDYEELQLILAAKSTNKPIIGICRGAQLLCVAAGGKLMQHIDNHNGIHDVTLLDEDGSVIQCNSAHHQMMVPPKNAQILAEATETTGMGEHDEEKLIKSVPEVVYFPSMLGLGIQPHPEWTNCPETFIEYCERKIKWILSNR